MRGCPMRFHGKKPQKARSKLLICEHATILTNAARRMLTPVKAWQAARASFARARTKNECSSDSGGASLGSLGRQRHRANFLRSPVRLIELRDHRGAGVETDAIDLQILHHALNIVA